MTLEKGAFMRHHINYGLVFILLLCWIRSASALELIPIECAVELVKNGITKERYSGACSYETPFVVASSTRMKFKSGVVWGGASAAPEWIMKEVGLGLRATVYVGHNLSEKNPMTNLTVDYSMVKLLDVRKPNVFIGKDKFVELEMPTIQEISGGGSAIFKKGVIEKVGGWADGKDTYEIRIGIR